MKESCALQSHWKRHRAPLSHLLEGCGIGRGLHLIQDQIDGDDVPAVLAEVAHDPVLGIELAQADLGSALWTGHEHHSPPRET